MTRHSLILAYHRTAEPQTDPWGLSVSPAHFAEHLEVIRRHARLARLYELTDGAQEGDGAPPPVAVTFDDGYGDNLRNAKPLLARADAPATVFAVSGMIGEDREFWWDELDAMLLQPGTLPDRLDLDVNGTRHHWEVGEGATVYSEAEWRCHRDWCYTDAPPPSRRHSLCTELRTLLQPLAPGLRGALMDELWVWSGATRRTRPGYRPLTADELLELDGGLVEVGAHTVTHALLPAHAEAEQASEARRSKGRLEDLLGRPITGFAYPYGCYDARTVAVVRRAGYEYACAMQTDGADPFELPRVKVRNWDGDEFERRLLHWLDPVAA